MAPGNNSNPVAANAARNIAALGAATNAAKSGCGLTKQVKDDLSAASTTLGNAASTWATMCSEKDDTTKNVALKLKDSALNFAKALGSAPPAPPPANAAAAAPTANASPAAAAASPANAASTASAPPAAQVNADSNEPSNYAIAAAANGKRISEEGKAAEARNKYNKNTISELQYKLKSRGFTPSDNNSKSKLINNLIQSNKNAQGGGRRRNRKTNKNRKNKRKTRRGNRR